MPAYFPTTSYFFQRERGVWVIIMIALTTTQFVGDTGEFRPFSLFTENLS